MKKVKIMAIITALLIAVPTIAACGADTEETTSEDAETTTEAATDEEDSDSSSDSEEAEAVTLTFQNFNASGNEDVLQEMIDAYTAENPNVTIEVQTVGYDGYFEQLQTQVTGGEAADIFELNLENFPSYAEDGAILDLTSYMTDEDYETYAGKSLEAFTYDDSQYGLPNSFSTCLLFYNKALFDEAGIDYPDSTWTWDDVDAAAAAISEIDGVWGYYQDITYNELYKAVAQNGGTLISDDGSAFEMTSDAVIETVTRMTDMVFNDYMPSADEMGALGNWDMFEAGQIGMLITGMWAFDTFTEACEFDWDVVVEPGAEEGSTATHFFSNSYCLNANIDEEKVEVALDFIRYITTSSECAALRIDAGWDLPPVSDEDALSTYLDIEIPSNRQAVFDSLEYAVVPTVTSNYSELQDIIASYLDSVLDESMTVDEAMAACQDELTSSISLG